MKPHSRMAPSEAPSEMAGLRLIWIAAPAISDSCAAVGRPLGSRSATRAASRLDKEDWLWAP
jgi:hypothetical protein